MIIISKIYIYTKVSAHLNISLIPIISWYISMGSNYFRVQFEFIFCGDQAYFDYSSYKLARFYPILFN